MGVKDNNTDKISVNVMRKAKNLKVVAADEEFSWWVSGGKARHLVWIDPTSGLLCDCIGFMMRKSCSHSLAVRLHLDRETNKEKE